MNMDQDLKSTKYFISDKMAAGQHISLSAIIEHRKCYECRQVEESTSKPTKHIRQIVKHCAEMPDYLMPDIPLKESIFRVILAGGNKPMTVDQISEKLAVAWLSTGYPRNIAPTILYRLLQCSQGYSIVPVTDLKS